MLDLRIIPHPTMPLRIALVLVVMFAGGCTHVAADDEAARHAAEDAVIAALLVDTEAADGDTLWLRPELDAVLSRPAEVDEAAWIAHSREKLAGAAETPRGLHRGAAERASSFATARGRRARRSFRFDDSGVFVWCAPVGHAHLTRRL